MNRSDYISGKYENPYKMTEGHEFRRKRDLMGPDGELHTPRNKVFILQKENRNWKDNESWVLKSKDDDEVAFVNIDPHFLMKFWVRA